MSNILRTMFALCAVLLQISCGGGTTSESTDTGAQGNGNIIDPEEQNNSNSQGDNISESRVLATFEGLVNGAPRISSDGKAVVFTGKVWNSSATPLNFSWEVDEPQRESIHNRLYIYDIENGTISCIVCDNNVFSSEDISINYYDIGNEVSLVTYVTRINFIGDENEYIYRYDHTNGSNTLLQTARTVTFPPIVTPDGRYMGYGDDDSDRDVEILPARMDLVTGEIVFGNSDTGAGLSSISIDGTFLFYGEDSGVTATRENLVSGDKTAIETVLDPQTFERSNVCIYTPELTLPASGDVAFGACGVLGETEISIIDGAGYQSFSNIYPEIDSSSTNLHPLSLSEDARYLLSGEDGNGKLVLFDLLEESVVDVPFLPSDSFGTLILEGDIDAGGNNIVSVRLNRGTERSQLLLWDR